MFNLQFTEVVIILVLALILLGPKQLPKIARSVGKGIREIRRTTDELKTAWDAEVHAEPPPTIERTEEEAKVVDEAWGTGPDEVLEPSDHEEPQEGAGGR